MKMKQKNIPTGNPGHGRVPRDGYSTAELRILSLETEGRFLSASDIKVANLNVTDYEDGFNGSPEEVIFE